jgi:GNAT superfamily N-acetyltransferase
MLEATIAVRAAGPQDAETIHRFISELAAFEREPDAVEATPESLRSQLASEVPPFECLIAEAGGEPAGFALFFHNFSTWKGCRGIWLEDIYVSPAFRRRGVASALMRALGRIALERGAGRLEFAVLDWNTKAHEFYREHGAKPLEEWTIHRMTEVEIRKLAEGNGKGNPPRGAP